MIRTHLDLFSGIGGFALAAQAAGFTTVGFSEIEPYACKVLKRHWPDVPNYGDIKNITIEALADSEGRKSGQPTSGNGGQSSGGRSEETGRTSGSVYLVTGGFPCQPFSVAGKQRGAEDDRHLWPEMCRVIKESRPTWVLGENVPGIINMELDRVLSDLENLGYACWALVIPAVAVDARHRRDRLWVVAHSRSGEGEQRHESNLQRGRSDETKQTGVGGGTLANPNETGRREQCGSEPMGAQHAPVECGGQNVSDYGRGSGEGPRASVSRQSQPSRWQPEPGMGRVADGIPNRSHRLKGLGNAIVPQVAEALLRMMANTPTL